MAVCGWSGVLALLLVAIALGFQTTSAQEGKEEEVLSVSGYKAVKGGLVRVCRVVVFFPNG